MSSVNYSLMVLEARKHELEKKLYFGDKEGWLENTDRMRIEKEIKNLNESIEVLKKHFKPV